MFEHLFVVHGDPQILRVIHQIVLGYSRHGFCDGWVAPYTCFTTALETCRDAHLRRLPLPSHALILQTRHSRGHAGLMRAGRPLGLNYRADRRPVDALILILTLVWSDARPRGSGLLTAGVPMTHGSQHMIVFYLFICSFFVFSFLCSTLELFIWKDLYLENAILVLIHWSFFSV